MFFKIIKSMLPKSLKNLMFILFYFLKNRTVKLSFTSDLRNVRFGSYNRVFEQCSLSNVILEDYSYVAKRSTIVNAIIGKFCSIGPNSFIGTAAHPSSVFVSTHPVFYSKNPSSNSSFSDKDYFEEFSNTIIGHDVWVGANVTIIGGVNVGIGSIIAAGAVVTKDVAPYSVVAGVPAKLIRYRFDQKEIEKLLESKWWDYNSVYFRENFIKFHDVNKFLN